MDELLLLSLLEKNARYDITDLATVLEAEESEVLEKINEFEKNNIIGKYHTVINWSKTNKEVVSAFIFVTAVPEREHGYDNIAKKIYKYPEVKSMHLVSGENDFILLITGKTMKEIAEFTALKLAGIEGIQGTSTLFILQTYKSTNCIFHEDEEKVERLLVSA